MTTFDLIWSRISRVTSFLLGMGIMIYETGWDHSDRPWLYAAAIGCMGLPIARAAESVLGRMSPSEVPGGHPEGERVEEDEVRRRRGGRR